jgi:hypothetical protein
MRLCGIKKPMLMKSIGELNGIYWTSTIVEIDPTVYRLFPGGAGVENHCF